MADRKLGEEISELLSELETSGYVSCRIQTGDAHLYMRRPVAPAPPPAPAADAASTPVEPPDPRTLLKSPRVGHFFPRNGGAGLSRGDRLSAGEVYGTIEAMHLKFELRADTAGVVQEFLAAEGEAVEYGQPLLALMDPEA
jgi:acetyl-CoA carboxylase biotin carboxyl carrier protein